MTDDVEAMAPAHALEALASGQALLVCAYDEDDPEQHERARRTLVAGAIPLRELIRREDALPRDQELILYCACPDDATARARADERRAAGFTRVRILEGGFNAWNEAGGGVAVRKRLARDVMTPSPEVVDAGTTVCVAAFKMRESDIGALPVESGGKFVGMITDRDITIRVTAEGKSPDLTSVADAMTTDFVCCAEDDDLNEVGRLMQEHRIRRIPVVRKGETERGHPPELVGIISLGDLATDLQSSAIPGETLAAVSEPTTA